MKRQSRTDKLKSMIRERLFVVEKGLALSPDEVDDKEYGELLAEAIRLRETLKTLE